MNRRVTKCALLVAAAALIGTSLPVAANAKPLLEVTELTYAQHFERSKQPIIGFTYGPDCQRCAQVEAVLERLADELPALKFVKLSVNLPLFTDIPATELPIIISYLPGMGAFIQKNAVADDEPALRAFIVARAEFFVKRAAAARAFDDAKAEWRRAEMPFEVRIARIDEAAAAASVEEEAEVDRVRSQLYTASGREAKAKVAADFAVAVAAKNKKTAPFTAERAIVVEEKKQATAALRARYHETEDVLAAIDMAEREAN